MLKRFIAAICLTAATAAVPAAQSDLDDFMARVLARRDENWKKLQQYTLNERDTLQITALAVFRLYGFEREYLWFPRDGFFIRSPLKADGVTIGEASRREAEDRWLRMSQRRERRTQRREKGEPPDPQDAIPCNVQVDDTCIIEDATPPEGPGDVVLTGGAEDIIRQSFEPEFIEQANFLRFKFDKGQYALVGRERMLDRDVLRIEYYPTLLFRDNDRDRKPPRDAAANDTKRDFEDEFEDKMNKVSLVTLWVDATEHQILRYEFRNVDMDFVPARWLLRLDGMRAQMQMTEAFPGVWLPASVSMRFRMRLAIGPVEGRYDAKYSNYRLPEVKSRVVP